MTMMNLMTPRAKVEEVVEVGMEGGGGGGTGRGT
jgi:hypothetical protein